MFEILFGITISVFAVTLSILHLRDNKLKRYKHEAKKIPRVCVSARWNSNGSFRCCENAVNCPTICPKYKAGGT